MAYGDPQFKKVFLPRLMVLDNLADLIHFEYGPGQEISYILTGVLNHIPKKRITRQSAFQEKEIKEILRSFRNAWYYEQYLVELREHKLFDFGIPLSVSLLYHSFLCAISSLIRITGQTTPEGAGSKINCYNNLIKNSPQYSAYLLFPFNFYFDRTSNAVIPDWKSLIKWAYGLESKCPFIEDTFRELSNTDCFSVINYLRHFREILQYQEAQIAAYTYGKSVLGELKHATRYLPYFFIGNVEIIFGLTMPDGFSLLEKEVSSFARPIESNFEIKLSNPKERIEVYKQFGLDKYS